MFNPERPRKEESSQEDSSDSADYRRTWVEAHVDAMISEQLEIELTGLAYPITSGTAEYPLLARLADAGPLDRFVADFGMTLEAMESGLGTPQEVGDPALDPGEQNGGRTSG